MINRYFFFPFLFFLSNSYSLFASGNGHEDPITPILLGLVAFLASAKIGGFLAVKFKQPVVLGELLAGVLVGNLSIMGIHSFESLATEPAYSIFASLGVILLLFEVGLESSLKDLLKVGVQALVVAIIGIIFPVILGVLLSHYFLPSASIYTHLFIGTALCATSVGITVRVLKDLRKTNTKESKIILGAAVIDDVLGLIILAIVTGVIANANQSAAGGLSYGALTMIAVKAIGFLILSLVIGVKVTPTFFKTVSKMKLDGALLGTALIFCFFLSYLANVVGLAPIVGAFAAGLIVDGHALGKYFGDGEKSVDDWIIPLSKFFVPIFFVHMGMQVNLMTFTDLKVLFFGICLGLVGILGKQACALGIRNKKGERPINRLAIGIGMVPRGEVGLIFAMIGSQLEYRGEPIISAEVYSAIIIMVVLTTMITPPALKWSLEKKK